MSTIDYTQRAHELIDESERTDSIIHAYDSDSDLHAAMSLEAADYVETRDQDDRRMVEYWGGGDLDDADTNEPRGPWRVHLHDA